MRNPVFVRNPVLKETFFEWNPILGGIPDWKDIRGTNPGWEEFCIGGIPMEPSREYKSVMVIKGIPRMSN